MRLIRWKAFIPLTLLLVLLVIGWIVFADTLVRRTVESFGTEIVGAKVELQRARVHLASGSVVLTGLQVTDPGAPMRNLVEAGEVVAAIAALPLLEKKLVIDSLALRGVRFGTPRTTSGAIPAQKSALTPALKRVTDWAAQIPLPSFSLEGLSGVVDISALSLDSLRSLTAARGIVTGADSSRQAWEAELRALDPRPQIDSAQALINRLKGVDVRQLGVQGMAEQVRTARATADNLKKSVDRVKALEGKVKGGVAELQARATTGLALARAQDYAYARGLVNLPSLDAPDISPALFGQMGLDRIKGLLYWISVAEEYLPPGLDPRRQTGPDRARAPGLTIEFPSQHAYPQFLLRFADADFSLGGENAAAGEYQAKVAGVTTQPALYGRPMQLVAQKTAGRVGPETVRVAAVLDHTRLPLKDSIGGYLSGLPLPTVTLAPLGARAALGRGVTSLSLVRVGEVLEARWYVKTAQPVWERMVGGTRGVVGDMLWGAVSKMKEIEVETQVRGTLAHPSLSVKSNVGTEIARALKQEVGAQVAKAEQLVRAKVDSVVDERVAEAKTRVDGVKTQVQAKIEEQRVELERVKAELEQKIKDLTPRLPGGIRLPGQD